MVKITSKLYRPDDLLEVINVLQKILEKPATLTEAKDIVIDLRKVGYKIVKVDNGQSDNFPQTKNELKR